MMTKEWITELQGHKIRVVKDWLDLDDGRRFSLVEVFMRSLLTTKAKICVDGRQVGGESF